MNTGPLTLVYVELRPGRNCWHWTVCCRGGRIAYSARTTIFEAVAAAMHRAREFVKADRFSVVVVA